jgi:hypothetical protein
MSPFLPLEITPAAVGILILQDVAHAAQEGLAKHGVRSRIVLHAVRFGDRIRRDRVAIVHREVARVGAQISVGFLLADQPAQRAIDRFRVLPLFVRVARAQKSEHGQRGDAAIGIAPGVVPVDAVFVDLHLAGPEGFRVPTAVPALHAREPAQAGLDRSLGVFGAAELAGVFFAVREFSQAVSRRDPGASLHDQRLSTCPGALDGGRGSIVHRLIVFDARRFRLAGCGAAHLLAGQTTDDHAREGSRLLRSDRGSRGSRRSATGRWTRLSDVGVRVDLR